MSDITKVLRDDHARIKRLFVRTATSDEWDLVLDLCDEIMIHATIEEDLVYPILRELDASLADRSEDEHESAKELVAEIQDLDPDDPAVDGMLLTLKKAMLNHIEDEERRAFKLIEQGIPDQLYEIGSQAFALRQELMVSHTPRRSVMRTETANVGWSHRRKESETGNMGF